MSNAKRTLSILLVVATTLLSTQKVEAVPVTISSYKIVTQDGTKKRLHLMSDLHDRKTDENTESYNRNHALVLESMHSLLNSGQYYLVGEGLSPEDELYPQLVGGTAGHYHESTIMSEVAAQARSTHRDLCSVFDIRVRLKSIELLSAILSSFFWHASEKDYTEEQLATKETITQNLEAALEFCCQFDMKNKDAHLDDIRKIYDKLFPQISLEENEELVTELALFNNLFDENIEGQHPAIDTISWLYSCLVEYKKAPERRQDFVSMTVGGNISDSLRGFFLKVYAPLYDKILFLKALSAAEQSEATDIIIYAGADHIKGILPSTAEFPEVKQCEGTLKFECVAPLQEIQEFCESRSINFDPFEIDGKMYLLYPCEEVLGKAEVFMPLSLHKAPIQAVGISDYFTEFIDS